MDKVSSLICTETMLEIYNALLFRSSQDRKTPLYLYGPSGDDPEEGTQAFAENLKKLMKWHVEAFSFLSTGLKDGRDGYEIIAKELPYMTVGGVAYEENGVKITHFPAVHDRNGSISYKLEWNGLSMIFSGDTIPNYYMIEQAKGIDVLIHEMVVPPEVWASKNSGLNPGDPGWERAVAFALAVKEFHTSQKAFAIYSVKQTRARVATHFRPTKIPSGLRLKTYARLMKGPSQSPLTCS